MQLKVTMTVANEMLHQLVRDGFGHHMAEVQKRIVDWNNLEEADGYISTTVYEVSARLDAIFPTQAESRMFREAEPRGAAAGWENTNRRRRIELKMLGHLDELRRILQEELPRYMSPIPGHQVFLESIDGFGKACGINPRLVEPLWKERGYLDILEADIKSHFLDILGEHERKGDWGGETDDLYSSHIVVNGQRMTAAFLLKGRATGAKRKRQPLRIKDCGDNGDQVERLFTAPAQLFVIQYVGPISQAVISCASGHVELLRLRGLEAWYCIMDRADTARVLLAYEKLCLPP